MREGYFPDSGNVCLTFLLRRALNRGKGFWGCVIDFTGPRLF